VPSRKGQVWKNQQERVIEEGTMKQLRNEKRKEKRNGEEERSKSTKSEREGKTKTIVA